MQSLKYVVGATLIIAMPYYLFSYIADTPSIEKQEAPVAGAENFLFSVEFSQGETEIPLAAQIPLQELAKKMAANKGLSVRIVGYAAGEEDETSVSRRVSLSRVLSIRTFLIGRGVDNLHITVEAKGNNVTSGNAERADIFVK